MLLPLEGSSYRKNFRTIFYVISLLCSSSPLSTEWGKKLDFFTKITLYGNFMLDPFLSSFTSVFILFKGYGLFTMEELKIRPDGTRLTRGPSTYKIPTADDAPKHFHVKLLKGSSNPYGIFSSKVRFLYILDLKNLFRMSVNHHYFLDLAFSLPYVKQCVLIGQIKACMDISALIAQLRRIKFACHVKIDLLKRCIFDIIKNF
jgi:hypothetical protein